MAELRLSFVAEMLLLIERADLLDKQTRDDMCRAILTADMANKDFPRLGEITPFLEREGWEPLSLNHYGWSTFSLRGESWADPLIAVHCSFLGVDAVIGDIPIEWHTQRHPLALMAIVTKHRRRLVTEPKPDADAPKPEGEA